jgi:hypothetical protein
MPSGAERRYQVFVSSTYGDLLEERQALTSALLQLNAFPSGMEIFPAADDDAWTLIERVIDECDYYLLVIAGKYGSTNEESGVSFTEREYDYATSKGKPVMAFVHAEPTKLPAERFETDNAKREKLEGFRAKVQKAKHVKYWRSAEDLAGKVALSYSQFVQQYPSIGWIRADKLASQEVLQEVVELRKRVSDLEGDLREASVGPPPEAAELASGGQLFSFRALIRGSVRTRNMYSSQTITHWFDGKLTWDSLFQAVAPKLLSEVQEPERKSTLNAYALAELLDEPLMDALVKEAQVSDQSAEMRDISGVKVSIDDETFETILVQFIALGLIQRGTQKRGINDRNKYWTVAPWGEKRALQLRAIRSGHSVA